MYQIQAEIDKKMAHIATLHDIAIKTTWIDMTPGAQVSDKTTAIAETAIQEVVGDANTMPAIITSGSDDVHFIRYALELKGNHDWRWRRFGPELHHLNLNFNHGALEIGVNMLAQTLYSARKKIDIFVN